MNFIIFTIYFLIFIFGLCIGSFLNCVIYRLERKKKITGRSFCPQCKHKLSWQDLFPVFSWVFLRGGCKYCKKKISVQYPLVELATGILLVLVSLDFGFVLNFGFRISDLIALCIMFYIVSSLIAIFVYDLRHYIIPDRILFPAIIFTLAYRFLEIVALNPNFKWQISNFASLLNYLLAAIVPAGFFFAIFWISRGKAIGLGDVKLALLMGLLLGPANVLVALFLSFFLGAVIGLILMAFGGKSARWQLKSEIPFGPFLITGTFIALFWGQQIIQWYINFFQI